MSEASCLLVEATKKLQIDVLLNYKLLYRCDGNFTLTSSKTKQEISDSFKDLRGEGFSSFSAESLAPPSITFYL